ncbi:MAG: phytanoyl-CoA dioxygenase family protein [bacterium]
MRQDPETPAEEFVLTDVHLRNYRRDGFLVRRNMFTTSQVSQLREAVERACANASQQASRGQEYFLDGKRFVDVDSCTLQYEPDDLTAERHTNLRVIEPVNEFDNDLDLLADDPRLTTPIRCILGVQVLSLWTAKLNLKPPGGAGFGWHQDSPYWMHDSNQVDRLPNVMLALDDQSIGNGCFEIIRGSHRGGMLPGTNDGTALGGFYTDPAAFAAKDAVTFEIPAGSLIFFDPHCVHGSDRNNSSKARRALIYTYQPGLQRTLKTGTLRPIRF